MDPAGTGALIGVSIMVVGMVGCLIRDKYLRRKKMAERARLLTPPSKRNDPVILVSTSQKKQSSMRDFFSKNTQSRSLKVGRFS